MASRKDQLNAYTFARKRTVAAFLQPSPSGTEEGAPRPVRAIMPSMVVGALILAGFGAWGIISPAAPQNWDTPGEYIIVGSESTTRYVVLEDEDEKGHKGPKQLHPVLNLASAKLLLDQGKGKVIKVKESVLDSGKVPHGATIGIPYAPDRLPSADDAGKAKRWAVCERPGTGAAGSSAEQAVLVLGGRDSGRVEGSGRLRQRQALYVEGPDGATYLVDPRGTRFLLGGRTWKQQPEQDRSLLRRALFGEAAQPQKVSREWLESLNEGSSIVFPPVPGIGETSRVPGLDPAWNTVGTVLKAAPGGRPATYVVLRNRVERVSGFTANLLLLSKDAGRAYPRGTTPKPVEVSVSDVDPDDTPYGMSLHWPEEVPDPVNTAEATGRERNVVCSVYRGTMAGRDRPRLSLWAGDDYPARIVAGATSAYVTPGTGLLYREVTGSGRSGHQYLVTDTGLRYSVASNTDSEAKKAVTGNAKEQRAQQENAARIRLGYDTVDPLPVVPLQWSALLSRGPALNTRSAAQPQNS